MLAELKDLKFQGLNLLETPDDLSPGESQICQNLMFKGSSLKIRPWMRSISSNLGLPSGMQILQLYWAPHEIGIDQDLPNSKVLYLWCKSSDDKYYMYATAYHFDSKRYQVRSITDRIRLIRYEGINEWPANWQEYGPPKMLPYEDETIFFNEVNVGIGKAYSAGVTQGNSEFVNAEGIFNPRINDWDIDGGSPLGFGGFSQYAVELINTNDGRRSVRFLNTFRRGSDVFTRGIPHSDTNGVFITFEAQLLGPPTPITDLQYAIYRKDDSLDNGVVDSEYYLIQPATDFTDLNPITWHDPGGNYDTKYGNAVIDPDNVAAQIGGANAATWWQSRVIWAQQGVLTFSNIGEPFLTTISNRDVSVLGHFIDGYIFHMAELLDTLVLFTNKGIFNLVGSIAQSELDTDVKPYHAKQNVEFVKTKNTVIVDDWIFVIAKNGVYKYNGRNLTLITDALCPLFEDFTEDDFKDMELGFDYIERRLYWKISDTDTYVYHLKGERFEGGMFTPGQWTHIKAEITNIDIGYISNEPDRESETLVPLFVIDKTHIAYFSDQVDTTIESVIDWIWKSKEFDGGTQYRRKKWRELRLFFVKEFENVPLSITTPNWSYDVDVTGIEDVYRYRLGCRSVLFNFRLGGTWYWNQTGDPLALSGFGLDAELIGV
jgi:hypothetical protein